MKETDKYIRWICSLAAGLTLTACSTDETPSFQGRPVDVIIALDGTASLTRASTDLSTGTAYLTGGANGMKKYTASGTGVVADETTGPLLWTANTMTVSGYYANQGQTAVESTLAYTVQDNSASFLAGEQAATYSEESRTTVELTLRQQLAYITITLLAETGTTLSNPKLKGIYTSGTFQGGYDANGFALGGTNSCGWNVSGETTDWTFTETATAGTYYAVILPQRIDAEHKLISIRSVDSNATDPDAGMELLFSLKETTTFLPGYRYNLKVDRISLTLTMEAGIEVTDFTDATDATTTSAESTTITVK